MVNQNLLNYIGLKPEVIKKLATGKNLEVHFGGGHGSVIGYIQDWGHNTTVIATPAVFQTGEDARGFLRGLLNLIRDNYTQSCPA